MRSFFILILNTLFVLKAIAGNVTGRITDDNDQPLVFSSITIKGTTQGTSANSSGEYSLNLNDGEYILIAQHVGYKSV
nr:carboxypeptidase-like regulatory domain-containing protein [Segetibacter sp.]